MKRQEALIATLRDKMTAADQATYDQLMPDDRRHSARPSQKARQDLADTLQRADETLTASISTQAAATRTAPRVAQALQLGSGTEASGTKHAGREARRRGPPPTTCLYGTRIAE